MKLTLIELMEKLGYSVDWYHRFLAEGYFMPFIWQEKNAIVITPPGIGKTQMVILTIVLIFILDPKKHVIVMSNTERLANMIARNVLQLLQSEAVQAIRPFEFGKLTESEFQIAGNDGRPSLLAVATGTNFVGSRCDYLIVDDAVKDQFAAMDDDGMEKLWGKFCTIAESRLVHRGVMCVVGTRFAITDFIGRLVDRALNSRWARQFSVVNLALTNEEGKDSYTFETKENLRGLARVL
jgi:hypothetical protein